MYDIRLTKQAAKDAIKVERAGLKPKAIEIRNTIQINPFELSQSFEKLKGDMLGSCSRRLNRQHRFIYQVLPNTEGCKDENGNLYEGIVKVISMWTHYE
ncbi:MAG: Txe/YoeB family addiction module toxin [Oscillospiraceae bacterium]|jgi:Txe/YoeB family toxin of toxin-antitoxin system|nr:Txe/YoeB family addiction module toxin [Oscillospiraceae bacterium]